jgi:hypothetical protein
MVRTTVASEVPMRAPSSAADDLAVVADEADDALPGAAEALCGVAQPVVEVVGLAGMRASHERDR